MIWFVDIFVDDSEKSTVKEKSHEDHVKEGLTKNAESESQDSTTSEIQENNQLAEPQTLFDQIKESVFKEELLIQSSEPLEIYFKMDQQSTVTKCLSLPFGFISKPERASIFVLTRTVGMFGYSIMVEKST